MSSGLAAVMVCCAVLYSACKPLAKQVSISASDYARELLGHNCQLIPNSTGTLLLAVEVSMQPRSRVLVVRVTDNKTLLDQRFVPGFARWKNDSAIELLDMPEAMPVNKNPNDFIRIITIENPLP
ncbi:MAG: hypothetical protein ACK5DD_08215 [Cyclobacteriaceae bacterium]|jgi:hypothetical protein